MPVATDNDDDWDDGGEGDDSGGSDDTSEDLIRCPECDAEIYGEAERCPRCGHYITEEDDRHQDGAPAGRRSMRMFGVVMLLLMAMALAGLRACGLAV